MRSLVLSFFLIATEVAIVSCFQSFQGSGVRLQSTAIYYDFLTRKGDGEKKEIGRLIKNIMFPGSRGSMKSYHVFMFIRNLSQLSSITFFCCLSSKGIYREYADTKETIKEIKITVQDAKNDDRNEGAVKFNGKFNVMDSSFLSGEYEEKYLKLKNLSPVKKPTGKFECTM